jgi:hypothetical protein
MFNLLVLEIYYSKHIASIGDCKSFQHWLQQDLAVKQQTASRWERALDAWKGYGFVPREDYEVLGHVTWTHRSQWQEQEQGRAVRGM